MNFTIEELIHSDIALENDIDNTPNDLQLSQLHKLINTILQPIRDKFGHPIKVNSGFRCKELNTIIGGAKNSQHMKGEAADITSYDNRKLWKTIRDMMATGEICVGQLINEHNYKWIHISLGEKNQILYLP